jgi:AAA+ superfamily predicted ATPase
MSMSTSSETASIAAFSGNEAHVAAEMGWVAELVRLAILEARAGQLRKERFDEFSGLYVSERDIARFVDGEDAAEAAAVEETSLGVEAQQRRVARERERIDALAHSASARGVVLRLAQLAEQFALEEVEYVAFLCCLAPDFDEELQNCFAYLQNEVSRRRPSVGLLADLCLSREDPLAPWRLFGPGARLTRNRLIVLPGGAASGEAKPFRLLAPRIPHALIGYLAGDDHPDELIRGAAELVAPRPLEVAAGYYRHHRDIAERLLAARRSRGVLPPSYIFGPAGCDKSLVAEAVAGQLGLGVLRVDLKRLGADRAASADVRRVLERDARVHGCLLHLLDPGHWSDDARSAADGAAHLNALLDGLTDLDVVLSGVRHPTHLRSELNLAFADYEIPLPSIEDRWELWSKQTKPPASEAQRTVLGALAGKFRFGPAQIRAVARAAEIPTDVDLAPEALSRLYRSCRNASNQGLDRYTSRMTPKFRWNDIVLPADTLKQLQEICACVNHRQTVFGGWGFDRKFSLGKGLNILFSGGSGTGKTMSAEIIALELGLDLYKIDLSSVVSKYIGETERNLSRIFGEAETSNSILFFDEADALFGKRSDVKDAHDRYANIEINYLLQKLDEYEGIIILATNLKNNLDAAFARRLNYAVEFPFPDESYRKLIWQKMFPEEAPLGRDIDFAFLAERFRLAGGNIKNIALNSAFMAATTAQEIRMEHIILAIKREYQKLGKLCTKSEYGPYFKFVREAVNAS